MTTATNALDTFRRAIESAGLTPPSTIEPGRIIRFPGAGKSNGNKAGWAWLSEDEQVGTFGDWSTGLSESWHAQRPQTMTPAERAAHKQRVTELQRIRKEEEARAHADAAAEAAAIWAEANAANDSHPYLLAKHVRAHGLCIDQDNRLILPVMKGDTFMSLQFIAPDGSKHFLPGGEVKGGYFVIGEPSDEAPILVAEGYATGASLHEATGYVVVVAFNAGNLLPVARALRAQYPEATILICGDHDENGIGQKKARDAAEAINGLVLIPDEVGRDWNDVAVAQGSETVRQRIAMALEPVAAQDEADATAPPESQASSTDEPFRLTDLGNAQRLVARHGREFRHCFKSGFFVWDGHRFAPDETGAMMRLATDTVRAIYGEAAQQTDESARKALADHAKKSEAAPRLQAMIELSKSDSAVVVTLNQLDADPWALNCANGVLDLRTATLRQPCRTDLMTKCVPVAYDPTATAPGWAQFLAQIMDGDQALITFLQKSVGYSLSGDVREQVFFMPYGAGSNGKSVFLSVLLALFGDYGKSTRTETLLTKKFDGIPNDVARLHGARLIAAVESEAGRRLAEALVKSLTGGDSICARFLRREFFEFRPTFKVWLAVNHKPAVRGTDHAIWRRIRAIPFIVTIPDEQQDKTLIDKLKGELPGILAWAIEGCRLWQQDGLAPPQAVVRATQTYRQEQDVLGSFLRECCIIEPEAKEPFAALYGHYTEPWCKDSGEKPITKTAFGIALRERGLSAKVFHGAQHWFGLRLRTALDPVDEEGDGFPEAEQKVRTEVNLDAD